MKKILIGLLTLSMLCLLGCQSTKALETYERAAEKTRMIKKGEMSLESTIVLPENMAVEPILFNLEGAYRENYDSGIYTGHFEIGGLGQDFTFYQISPEHQYLYLQLMGKYINLSQLNDKASEAPLQEEALKNVQEDVFRTFFSKVSTIWQDLLVEENVMRGEKVLIDNEDGDVKATKYTINLTEAQRLALTEAIKAYYKQEQETFEPEFAARFHMTREAWREKVDEAMKEWLLKDFSVTAYVDYDDYIIDEMVNMTVLTEESYLEMTFSKSQYHINQEVELAFPEIEDDQWLDFETLNQGGLK